MTTATNPATAELAPCPFCGGATRIESNRDWHRLYAMHDDDCVFDADEHALMFPAQPGHLVTMVEIWNRRATQASAEPEPQVERIQINLVELCEDSVRNQPCAHGSLVGGHAVYCHNGTWKDAPRKCRRTWYTGGEVRDEDCEGFAPNPAAPSSAPSTEPGDAK